MDKHKALAQIAQRLRIHSFRMTTKAGSGHPTTCSSMAELIACLFFDEMRYNIRDPFDWSNDEFVLSKGHAAPILWAAYAEAGIISQKSLMDLRRITSSLEGHPTPRMKWVKAATGSLGQGLSVGVGLAMAMKFGKCPRRVYVMMGDGECAEGAVWEGANTAALLGLHNLCAVVDINRLGQSDPTMHGHDLDAYKKKFEAFGWKALKINGHRISEILSALKKARESKKPTAVLAKTIKGKGVSFLEDRNGYHGKPMKQEDLRRALHELGPMAEIDSRKHVKKPRPLKKPRWRKGYAFPRSTYESNIPTRKAYGKSLVKLGKINHTVVAIDGDVKNSTYAEDFFDAFPQRSFEIYIAEQNMVGIGIGMAARGLTPFIATFAAFLCRAHDQIRMAGYSFSNMKLVGSHVGVSIGADGPSQMGLEDLAIFRPIPGCAVLYPSDGYSAEGCTESMARYKGMAYLRATRPGTPLLYNKNESFPIGGSKVLKRSRKDAAAVIAAGITVHEALKSYEELKKEDVAVRIIDAYSIQPLDEKIIQEVAGAGNKAVVVEDHFRNGGLGDAVASLLNGKAEIFHLAVDHLPRSGEPHELMDKYGISSRHITHAVKRLTEKK